MDVNQLAELTRASCDYQRKFDNILKQTSEVDWTGYVSSLLKRDNAEIFVADMEKVLVGYMIIRIVSHGMSSGVSRMKMVIGKLMNRQRTEPVSITLPRRYGFMEDIYVVPKLQKSPVGISFRLYKRSLQWFKERKVHSVEATIAMDNNVSHKFFRKLGYEPVRVLIRKNI
jgi:hypothetical protein